MPTRTNGQDSGAAGRNRRQVFWIVYAGYAALLLVNNLVNAVSQTTELDRAGRHFRAWEPYCWEMTSAASSLALFPAVAWLLRLAPPGPGRWLKFVAVHGAAIFAYSFLHVVGFHGLRRLIYLLVGGHYKGALDLGYEFPKDLRSYLSLLATLWAAGVIARLWALAAARRAEPAAEAIFDIKEGTRTIRAPTSEILAATSEGNYVEFRLADGRRPLMRSTLGAIEAALRTHGFLRTHRCWLINPRCVRGLISEGAGDYRVELEGGVEAPLSRRFPEALAALRAPVRA